jgi:lysophospholipid acyltransferase (LPLAT)-like uncharacterized protein
MKIRHPSLIKATGFSAAWLIRLWLGSLRFHYRPLGPRVAPDQPGLRGRYIYAFWHENMLLPAYQYGRPDVWVLVSKHADGQLIGETCRHLRLRLVYGSTTRGGVAAVRNLLRASQRSHLVITPDGPRGPRRRVQTGLVYLAARTGLPIVPTGIGYDRPWRLRSWDRFALPRPGSEGVCVTHEPVLVPADVDKTALEEYRRRVEEALTEATLVAEQLSARAA